MREDALFREKHAEPQAKLKKKEEKRRNIEGVFSVKNGEKIKNKKIILLDDVATSLATMEEAAKVLKQNGVKEIWGLVVAKG